MADRDLAFAGAARQAELVRAGEVSPKELVQLYLDRIERLDSRYNAYRVVLAERALAEAEEAEKRRAAGADAPLLGVPVAIKDTVDVAGEVTCVGTKAFDAPAAEDSEMVKRLRAAGAIVIGKTNLSELAICAFTETEAWGITRNPWDTGRTPGGSSGGTGAAVAAGLAPIGSASDGAGSIRFPAALCGLVGLKPQRGRVPLAPAREHWHGLSVNGCNSRTVLDTALYLDAVCAPGPTEPEGPPLPGRPFVEAARTPPGRLRIAHSTKPPRALALPIISDESKGAVASTVELLRGLGHEVFAEDPKWGSVGNPAVARYLRGIADEVAEVPHPERLEPRTRGFGRLGRLVPRAALRRARRLEEKDAARINSIFERCDVLMMPTVGTPPVEIGRWEGRGALRTLLGMSRVYPYGVAFNHTGQPACSVPAGFADGLPLSVQLVGRPNDEATLISLAAQLEAERGWPAERPPGT